ncbi:MAG: hypothetical protein L0287_26360 [Anaerolineae bacterium]|nr:hypothetical protein [Anaerolineae bacterium]MCI0610533.1 hypothetical protein [Anaerolineae bacterium]
MVGLINVILGGGLLLAGRKLFWLFVGAIGFVTGLQLASNFWQGPESSAIIFGLIVGVIFALLAIFLQTIAIGIAGFFAGGFTLTALAGMFGVDTGSIFWIIYVIGGIIGLVVVIYLFDWAIITLSSLAGASLLVQAFLPQGGAGGVIFAVLVIIGVVVQGSVLRSEQSVRT